VEALARHYTVMSYSRHLRKRLPPATLRTLATDEALIALLRRSAILVTGNWVLKSELAGFEGIEMHARDLLLVMLNNFGGVLKADQYSKWQSVLKGHLPQSSMDEITRNMLEGDKANPGSMRLKERPDEDFIRRFPKVVAEYKPFFDKLRIQATQGMNAQKAAGQGARGRQQMAMQSASQRQKAKLSQEVREALAHSAMKLGELRRTIQKNNTTVAIREEEIAQVLQAMGEDVVKVRELFVISRTGNDANDAFRNVVHTIFRSRDHVSMADILQEYERVNGEACRLSSFSMRTFLREIADKLDGDNWVMKGALAGGAQ